MADEAQEESTTEPGLLSMPEKERIAAFVRARCKRPCPRCNTVSFTLVDGYVNLPIDKEAGPLNTSLSMPCAALICDYCGAVFLHALSSLGPMPHPVRSSGGTT